jgi:hypothetical protein
MTDQTQTMIKAAIIESRAVEARQQAAHPTMTSHGKTANYHSADALIWAVSVLTAEPVAIVRERVNAAARDCKPLDAYKPRRAVA